MRVTTTDPSRYHTPIPPLAVLASILALSTNVAVSIPTPQASMINDTFLLSPSDANSGPLPHCAGNPPPIERPPSLAIERFSTEPSNAGIGVTMPFPYYQPLIPFMAKFIPPLSLSH